MRSPIWIPATAVLLLAYLFSTTVQAGPPILSEEQAKQEAQAEADKDKPLTPEQEQEKKKEEEVKGELRDVRKRQEKDEEAVRVRAGIFPAQIPQDECTAADRARNRLQEVIGDGGVVIAGDVTIDSANDAEVGKNQGSINNNVNVNIINENGKKC